MNPSEEELKREITRVTRTLYQRGLINALEGNVSARIPGKDEFWITPSQVFKGDLKAGDLIKMNLRGEVLEGTLKPSIEWRMHSAIYIARSDVNAVVHAHNPLVLALSLLGRELRNTLTLESALLGRVGRVGFKLPGSGELAEAVAETARAGVKAIVLDRHGVVGLGATLVEAEAIVESLESLALIEYICYSLGEEPKELSRGVLESLWKFLDSTSRNRG